MFWSAERDSDPRVKAKTLFGFAIIIIFKANGKSSGTYDFDVTRCVLVKYLDIR